MEHILDHEDRKEIERCLKDKRRAEKKDNLKEVATLCNTIGHIYAKYGQWSEAISKYETELGLQEALGDTIDAAVACRNLGECYCGLEQFDKALCLQQRHLSLARSCSSKIEEQRALATIGRTYLVEADSSLTQTARLTALNKAEEAFMKSLEMCVKLSSEIKEIDYAEMRTRLYLNLGLVYEGKGDMSECSQYMKKAIGLSQKFNLYDDLYRCQFNLASIYQRACNYEQAQKFISQACATAKKMRSKLMETEAMYQKAIILVQVEDFAAARHLLKKCNKYGTAVPEKVKSAYKTAAKMEKIQEEMKSLPEGDSSKIKLYEKMADSAVDIGNYKHAITYYMKTLAHLKSSGADKTDLIPIYVSLAQTYKDDKQYDKAIENYHSEIRLRGEEEGDQICRTWLNIAEVQELQGLEYNDINKSYLTAYETAKKAKHRILQVRSLASLCELQKLFKKEAHRTKMEAKLKETRSKYNLDEGDDMEDESQEVDTSSEEEVEMSDLTDSEDEETETGTKAVQGISRKISHKRNYLGETPLHRACIEGNLKRVKKLIDEGHPMNPQDNSGWTPLHEASNHNFYEIVEYLLSHGAAIDHRGGDQCGGVTPLIDAASCGHVEIMQLLIERGANVLCKDDKHQTALDTILAWQRDNEFTDTEFLTVYNSVVELLKEKTPHKGSSSRSRQEPLSQATISPLISQSSSEELPRISRQRREKTFHRSRNSVINDTDSDSDGEQEKPRKRNSSPRTVKLQQTDDSEEILLNPLLEDLDVSTNATEAYRSAMTCIGSSAARASQATRSKSQRSRADSSALIREDEYVDDWLIDDLQPMKRRKVDINGLFTIRTTKSNKKQTKTTNSDHRTEQRRKEKTSSVRCRIEDSDIESDTESESREIINEIVSERDDKINDTTRMDYSVLETVCDNIDGFDSDLEIQPIVRVSNRQTTRKPKQTKITSFGTLTANVSIGSSSDSVDVVTSDTSRTLLSTTIPSSGAQVITQNVVSGSNNGRISGIIRVKVQIKDKLLLIPVINGDGRKTMSWLSEEASQRYYKMFGLKPTLTLGTKDGAFFSPDDLVTDILVDNDKIEGFIDNWDLPPLAERYNTACKALNTVIYRNVRMLLQQSESSGKLNLPDLALRVARFQPVIRSLQYQTCLRELNIQGNRIGDVGMKNLCKILDTLPNLSVLDLTCNDITPVGLNHLCSAITVEETKCLQVLSSLNLSHNLFYDGCLVQLTTLVSNLPRLGHLDLSSCYFTMKVFQNDRLQFATALQASSIQHLDMSLNQLGCVGVELLLKCQHPAKLLSLNLSHTVPQTSAQIYRHLFTYLSEDDCALQDLKLQDCHLGLEDTDFLVRLPGVGKQLQRLDISINPKLDNKTIQQLIKMSCESSSLEELICNTCGLCSPLDVDFLDAISDKLSSEAPLRKLHFTCHKLEKIDSESLGQIWRDRWAELAQVDIVEQSVKLGVADK